MEKAWTGEPKGQDSSKVSPNIINLGTIKSLRIVPAAAMGAFGLEMFKSGSVLPGQVCRRIRRQKPDSEGANRVHVDASHCIQNQNLHNVREFQC